MTRISIICCGTCLVDDACYMYMQIRTIVCHSSSNSQKLLISKSRTKSSESAARVKICEVFLLVLH